MWEIGLVNLNELDFIVELNDVLVVYLSGHWVKLLDFSIVWQISLSDRDGGGKSNHGSGKENFVHHF